MKKQVIPFILGVTIISLCGSISAQAIFYMIEEVEYEFLLEGNPIQKEVIELIKKNPSVINEKDEYGDSPLHKAAQIGNLPIAQALIDVGADVNAADKDGWTPLHVAIRDGHDKIVELLLKKGVDVNVTTKFGDTLTDIALGSIFMGEKNEDIILQHLINKKPNVVIKQNKQGRTPLNQLLHELVKHPDFAFGKVGIAKVGDREKFAELLIKSGADVNKKDNNGRTLLHKQAREGNKCGIEFLLKHGARINEQDEDENTPLHLAARFGHMDIVRLLVEKGANITLKNEEGKTPAQVAKTDAIKKYLLAREKAAKK